MRASALFSEGMDQVIKELYPVAGGQAVIDELKDKYNKTFSLNQIYSRTSVLGVTGRSAAELLHSSPQPHWPGWPKLEIHGPNPWIVGKFVIIDYLGYKSVGGMYKGPQHRYWVRCLMCGAEAEKLQQTIIKARDSESVGCAKCAKQNARKEAKARLSAEKAALNDRLQAWLWVMKTMPITSLAFIPESQRFDGRRF